MVKSSSNSLEYHWYYCGFAVIDKRDIMRLIDAISLLSVSCQDTSLVIRCRAVVNEVLCLGAIGRSV